MTQMYSDGTFSKQLHAVLRNQNYVLSNDGLLNSDIE